MAALQNGARIFVNYCLNCHSAQYMRYNRLHDIGLSDDQIKKNLLFATEKVGDTMRTTLDPKQAKDWFGATPPDLSVIARSRAEIGKGSGADYLYTLWRTFYRDDAKPTGWNNLAFPDIAMPHALWQLQGERRAVFTEVKDAHNPNRTEYRFERFEQVSPGTMSELEYKEAVGDLVAYLQWMGEPAQGSRIRIGVGVLLFLGLLIVFTWRLNAAYWKNVT
jgi:ubiquinol-cytochrome c reductase cytochrome c1 subunit